MYNDTDIAITPDGDLSIDSTGDLELATGLDCLEDDIDIQLKTQTGEFVVWPSVGADLEAFMGSPNRKEIGDAIIGNILLALTTNGVVDVGDIQISALPVEGSIVCYIIIRTGSGEELRVQHEVELRR